MNPRYASGSTSASMPVSSVITPLQSSVTVESVGGVYVDILARIGKLNMCCILRVWFESSGHLASGKRVSRQIRTQRLKSVSS